jgi:RNA polymerase sigma-70 factor (ECF subfamily)
VVTGRPTASTSDAGADVSERDLPLLAQAARGDVYAFDTLIRGRLDRLFRMAVAILRSEADASDVVQETCVKAWRELPNLRDRKRFDAWLAQILVNGCRSSLRRRRRAQVREIDVEAIGGDDGDQPGGALRTETDALPEVEAIRRAFDRLDGGTRALLVMHYVEERPMAEIAAIAGSPVGTIKWRMSNARKALERALEVERR